MVKKKLVAADNDRRARAAERAGEALLVLIRVHVAPFIKIAATV
jgi:hypothetical protein